MRTILHVDMDAFYASVEVLLDPTLAGKPLIVGGSGARGVVASCSYEARAFGVRSAMSSIQARRLCPTAVFVAGNHGVYADYSRRLHEVFLRFTPLIEPLALDEAFLDVTAARRLFGSGVTLAIRVRDEVHDELGLWCSVGVATSKLIAKLASKAAKPEVRSSTLGRPDEDRWATAPAAVGSGQSAGNRGVEGVQGVVIIAPGEELTFLHGHPARSLWGIGPATFSRLARFGVQTVGDLARLPEDVVVRALGTANGRQLHALAWGRDERPVEPDRPLKSVGHEETFAEDHHGVASLATEALRMSDSVARRLRQAGVRGRTVQLKVRFGDFRTITRSRTLERSVDTAPVIATTAVALLGEPELAEEIERLGVRLLGVSVAGLAGAGAAAADAPPGEQLDLFSDQNGGPAHDPQQASIAQEETVAATIDAIRDRFGDGAVGLAAFVTPAGLRLKRAGDTQWGPDAPRP